MTNFVSFVDVVTLSVGIYIYYIILKQKCSCSRIHFYVLNSRSWKCCVYENIVIGEKGGKHTRTCRVVHLVCGKVDEGNDNKRNGKKPGGGEIVNCEESM